MNKDTISVREERGRFGKEIANSSDSRSKRKGSDYRYNRINPATCVTTAKWDVCLTKAKTRDFGGLTSSINDALHILSHAKHYARHTLHVDNADVRHLHLMELSTQQVCINPMGGAALQVKPTMQYTCFQTSSTQDQRLASNSPPPQAQFNVGCMNWITVEKQC